MAEKRYRPKSGNEGLTVEFPGTEGYVTIKPSDWPYAPKNAGEEAYLDNLDEVTDRPPPRQKTQASRTSRAKKAQGDPSEGSEGAANAGGPIANGGKDSAKGNGNEGGEG